MKYYIFSFFLFSILFFGCKSQESGNFTEEVLKQNVFNTQMQPTQIQSIIDSHKGKKVVIDIWASWCGDCMKSLPKIEKFQAENPDVEFIFLSVDDNEGNWKNGLTKFFDQYKIKGEQYFFNTGWTKDDSNAFIDFAQLDWIPRYMVLDESGDLVLYYAKSIEDNKLRNVISKKN